MRKEKIYRGCLWCALLFSCISLFGVWFMDLYGKIPENIRLRIGEEQVFDMGLPISGEIISMGTEETAVEAATVNGNLQVDMGSHITMLANTESSYRMNLKLFGWIPFKQVNIEVIRDLTLTPVGMPIGIYLKTDGILVIGIGDFLTLDGVSVSPARYLLQSGDYILAVDRNEVTDKDTFVKIIEGSDGKAMVLTVKRGTEVFDVSVRPACSQNGKYKLGIWVRDSAQGVGTMTFIDSDGNFGALGHGINDVDTSLVMELDSGTLYKTEIIAIKKGSKGDPGEMTGMIEYADRNILGIVTQNTEKGIFGICNEQMISQIEEEALPVALKQEVELGAAQILCTVDGTPQYYDIVIKELHLDHNNANKGIVLQVTDPDLIALTGGIVQGMSGAPIIQNGKLVGAVTHVLVSDATSGYGIFIEEMLTY